MQEGGTDYKINLSGDFDTRIQTFLSSVKSLDDVIKSIKASTKSSGSGSSGASKDVSDTNAQLDKQKAIRADILKLEKSIATANASETTALKAQLKVLKDQEKAEVAMTVASDKQLKNADAVAIAQKKTADQDVKSLAIQKAIAIQYKAGVTSLQEIAAATGYSERALLSQSEVLRAQESIRKKQLVDAKALAVLERKSETLSKRKEAQAKKEALAKNTIYQASKRIETIERKIASDKEVINQLDKKGIKNVTELARLSGFTEDKVRGINGQTKKATTTANKLLFSFKQVALTVAKFQIARQLFESVGFAVTEMSRFNGQIEAAEIGISSLVASVGQVRDSSGGLVQGIDAFNGAMKISTRIIEQLRQDALRTEATFEGLVQAFQVAVGPGLAAGLNLEQIRSTTVDITRAATQMGVPIRQFSEEIRSILQGTIKLSTTRLAPLFTNEEIRNAKEQGTLYQLLTERLAVYGESAEVVSKSFEVLKSNVQDSASAILASGGTEYFESLKLLLGDISNILSGNDEGFTLINAEAVGIVETIGEVLNSVVEDFREFIADADNIESLNKALKVMGSIFSAVVSAGLSTLSAVFDVANKLLVPVVALVDAFENLSESIGDKWAGVLKSSLSTITSMVVSLAVMQKLFVAGNAILVARKAILTTIAARRAAILTASTGSLVSGGLMNALLVITSRLTTAIAAKVTIATAGIALLLGVLATTVYELASASDESADSLDGMSDSAEELIANVAEMKEGFKSLPISISEGNSAFKTMIDYSEKLDKTLKSVNSRIQISAASARAKEFAKDAVKAQETIRESTQAELRTQEKVAQSREEQRSILEAQVGSQADRISKIVAEQEAIQKQSVAYDLLKEKTSEATEAESRRADLYKAFSTILAKTVLENGTLEAEALKFKAQQAEKYYNEELSKLKEIQEYNKSRSSIYAKITTSAKDEAQAMAFVADAERLVLDAKKEAINYAEQQAQKVADLNRLKAEDLDQTVEVQKILKQESTVLKAISREQAQKVLDKKLEEKSAKSLLALEAEVSKAAKITSDKYSRQEDNIYKSAEATQLKIDNEEKELKIVEESLSQTLSITASGKEYNNLIIARAKVMKQIEGISVLTKQNEEQTKTLIANNNAARAQALEADAQKLQNVEAAKRQKILSNTLEIDKMEVEMSRELISNAVKKVGIAAKELKTAQLVTTSIQENRDANIQSLIVQRDLLQEGKKRKKVELALAKAQADRVVSTDLENTKIKLLTHNLKEAQKQASNDFATGLSDGFREFVAESPSFSATIADTVNEGLNGVASTFGSQIGNYLDPRENTDWENAFADMFYGLAGSFAEEVSKQLLAKGVTILMESASDGMLSDSMGVLTAALGLNTTATEAETLSDTTGVATGTLTDSASLAATATAGGEDAGMVSSFVEGFSSLFSGMGDTLSSAFGGLGTSMTGGLGTLTETTTDNGGFMQSILGFFPTLLGFLATTAGGVLSMAASLVLLVIESVVQTGLAAANLVYQAIIAIFAAIPFFKNGGIVKGFADGGKVQGFAGGGSTSSLRSFQKAHSIPSCDTVPAMLTPGEFVMVPDAVKRFGVGFMNALNTGLVGPQDILGMPSQSVAVSQGAGVQAFAQGGVVSAGTAQSSARSSLATNTSGPMTILPVMVADNASMGQLATGGRETFEKSVNRTNITGDKNKTKEW